MLRRLDDFLIDRVFQKIADAAARWVSCYGIAAFLLTGAGLMKVADYSVNRDWFGLAFLSLWAPGIAYRAYQLDAKASASVLPPDRVGAMGWRLWSVATNPLDLLCLLTAQTWWDYPRFGAWFLVTPALYFMACRRNPPKEKRAVVPVAVPNVA